MRRSRLECAKVHLEEHRKRRCNTKRWCLTVKTGMSRAVGGRASASRCNTKRSCLTSKIGMSGAVGGRELVSRCDMVKCFLSSKTWMSGAEGGRALVSRCDMSVEVLDDQSCRRKSIGEKIQYLECCLTAWIWTCEVVFWRAFGGGHGCAIETAIDGTQLDVRSDILFRICEWVQHTINTALDGMNSDVRSCMRQCIGKRKRCSLQTFLCWAAKSQICRSAVQNALAILQAQQIRESFQRKMKCAWNVVSLFSECSQDVPRVFSLCAHYVLIMFWEFSQYVLTICSECTQNVLRMCSECAHDVLIMCFESSQNILRIFSVCYQNLPITILRIFSECAQGQQLAGRLAIMW